ncbi:MULTISPECIES: hypothetical protein [unclassified Pseudoalteromonas]|uniref:hypothetical protein n=1 Tax=unclassified Pseudoalteromonas TaxID=194690 RepID=UPI002097D706|nr:hypothetical protein [Pseudoalteromonas sp. XMcav2-N]MCO7188405.1 hypothetical protein [Pseudoalteromonas sp. XMcav2-N]
MMRPGINKVSLLDTTLRDGSYAVDFKFSTEFAQELMTKLESAQVDLIEVGHGLGLEAELAGYDECTIDVEKWCELSNLHLKDSGWGMFVQPHFSRLPTIDWLTKEGMSFVRVGVEAQGIESQLDYIESCLSLNTDVYLNIMKTSNVTPDTLAKYLEQAPKEVAGIYVVDSCGTMLPSRVSEYVQAIRPLNSNVGFHGHDNLGMANANSLAAIKAGANIVDATLNGMGRGAGNASTESLAAILTSQGNSHYDYQELCKLADYCSSQLDICSSERYAQVIGGVFGVHSSLFPLIKQLSADLQLDFFSLMKLTAQECQKEINEANITKVAKQVASAQCEAS